MKTKGIRIKDKRNGIIYVQLPDILNEIYNGMLMNWSILFLDAVGDLGEGKSLPEFEQQIYNSEKGFFIKWDILNILSTQFTQIINIILIGCFDEKLLVRYKDDKEMYETCDIVIEMFDSSFWEVFSKDESMINRLAAKFKEVEFLESDFLK